MYLLVSLVYTLIFSLFIFVKVMLLYMMMSEKEKQYLVPLRYILKAIWAASSEFGTYRLCEQRRFRQACAVSPEPPLLAHTSSESRGTFRQKARSLAPLNGRACTVKICHDRMLEDTNSLDGSHLQSWCTQVGVMAVIVCPFNDGQICWMHLKEFVFTLFSVRNINAVAQSFVIFFIT